jgi:mono/diheme cytochrome c family protein
MGRRGLIPLFFSVLAAAAAASACDRAPSPNGLAQWTPADHDQEQGRPAAPNQGGRASDAGGTPALVEVAWRNQCASCHGMTGRGDGPQGALFHAADLAQSKMSDDELANTIRNGKGRMPKFDLPDDVVTGLVARIRSFRGN